MSEQLRRILTGWLAWVESGAPVEHVDAHNRDQAFIDGLHFRRDVGLCWHVSANTNWDEAGIQELQDLFQRSGLRTDYPFHEAYYQYDCEANEDISYQNLDRIKWVKEALL